MHHRQRGDERLVVEVLVEAPDLVGEQHALVDDRARRERRHVELLAVPELERLDRVPRALADHVQLALQRVGVHVARAAADEHLPDHRLDLLGALGESRVAGRNVAPAEHDLPLGVDRALDLLLAGHARRRLLRQEHHADAVLTDRGQRDAELAARPAQEGVRHLHEDPGTVALQRIGPGRTAVREVLEDRQALADDRVRLAALDVGHEAQSAGVVLVGGAVEALAARRPRAQWTTLRANALWGGFALGAAHRAHAGSGVRHAGDLVMKDAECPAGRRKPGRRPASRKTGGNLGIVLRMLHCGNKPGQLRAHAQHPVGQLLPLGGLAPCVRCRSWALI